MALLSRAAPLRGSLPGHHRDGIVRFSGCSPTLRIYAAAAAESPAPVVRAALEGTGVFSFCSAAGVAWRLCSAVLVQRSPRSAGPARPRRRRGCVVPNNCETPAVPLYSTLHQNFATKPLWRCSEGLLEKPLVPRGAPPPPEEVGAAPCNEHNTQSAATWLILPVVICLSQRLSHACLSAVSNS